MTVATSEYGVVLESGAVRFERLLPGPIERVWAYLTESEKRATWFAGGDFDLREGGERRLLFKHSLITKEPPPEKYRQMSEEGCLSLGTITRCEPPYAIAFTWGEGASEVTFELSAHDDKVMLVLTHRRLTDRTEMTNVSGGWHLHLDLLEDQLTGRPPSAFWSRHEALEAEYAERQSGAAL
jgi:uncharacterized protein YndB with AHSA1/START domain